MNPAFKIDWIFVKKDNKTIKILVFDMRGFFNKFSPKKFSKLKKKAKNVLGSEHAVPMAKKISAQSNFGRKIIRITFFMFGKISHLYHAT